MPMTKVAHFALKDGGTVPVEIKHRKGARHLRLSLGLNNQLVASVPWRCKQGDITRFLEKNRAWAEMQLSQAPRLLSLEEWFERHPTLSGSGDQFLVSIEQTNQLKASYRFEKGGADIVLRLPNKSESLSLALNRLVRRFAKDALPCRVAYHAKRLGLNYNRVSARDQKSRWGSCSSNGDLSLNWRLVLLEPDLQDYVILHELAHLTEMNHSARFWSLLETYDPDLKQHETVLDAVTAMVMRVGRL